MKACFKLGSIAVALLLFVALSCQRDRYEIKEDKLGRTIRLDKKTGEIMILDGNKLVKVKKEDELRVVLKQNLAEPKYWPATHIPQIGVERATLVTILRSGHLQYVLHISPVPKEWYNPELPLHRFTLIFYDKYNFRLLVEKLYAYEFGPLVDDQSKQVGLYAEGKITCSRETYESLATWNFAWTLGGVLIPSVKGTPKEERSAEAPGQKPVYPRELTLEEVLQYQREKAQKTDVPSSPSLERGRLIIEDYEGPETLE